MCYWSNDLDVLISERHSFGQENSINTHIGLLNRGHFESESWFYQATSSRLCPHSNESQSIYPYRS